MRRGGELFVVEGRLAVAQLVRSPYPIAALLLAEEKVAAAADLVAAGRDQAAPVYVASRAVVRATVGFDLHRGVLAAGRRLAPTPPEALWRPGATRLLAAEGVNDHENLGGLFRNAAAFGADGVLLDPTCADPLYRRSIRVSLGHVLHLPFARATAWPTELDALRAAGWDVAALTPGGETELGRWAPDGPVALVVGAEGGGLSPEVLAATSRRVRIPMAHGVDSLNVATAAAIALYHVAS
ncbi:MAG TPA: RNA methyltransferase [Acidimicrobiales bacterium]|nr:RNA methyltransferase [Acidimicrobiales bacterium]